MTTEQKPDQEPNNIEDMMFAIGIKKWMFHLRMGPVRKSKHLPPFEDESDDTFAFIAGYTPAGFPYGTTWAELGIDPDLPIEQKRRLYEATTTGDQLLNVDQGDDDELPF